MVNDPQQALPVQTLEYQLPGEAAATPWAGVVRVVGWAAAAVAVAHLGSGASATAFEWATAQAGFSFDASFYWINTVIDAAAYLPVLVGGIACARHRRYGWRLLTGALWVVLAVKAVLVLLSTSMILIDSLPPNWSPSVRAAMVASNLSSHFDDAVPAALMLWLLRRPGARQLFASPRPAPWAPEQN
jgi:hypothetical protein